jgi:kynureninase
MLPDERFRADEAWARRLDEGDPLASWRSQFHIPRASDGRPVVYLAGNSLGLQPKAVAAAVGAELEAWARLGVEAHFSSSAPWYSYHELVREPLARLVGAHPDEVVAMNSLTVNLHLMLVTFYRPTPSRFKILIEDCAFPSDRYAMATQLGYHGHDDRSGLVVARPAEIEDLLERHGSEIALVLLGGVNYYTGQLFDMRRIAACAHEHGCVVGFDLAHAAGNVPLALHDWDVDFAVWCSYKYLNAGPGSVGGCFVHRRHSRRTDLPRFGGWWGNDPQRRFRMHLESEFKPVPSADGWQLSNPSILALAPLRVAVDVFDRAGMDALRTKSRQLTAYLEGWVQQAGGGRIELLTPGDAEARGCQLSLRPVARSRELFDDLTRQGIVADYRDPGVIRLAPVPLYNSFHDVWTCGRAIAGWGRGGS